MSIQTTVALVQMARAAGLAARPSRRMPRAAYPHLIELAYARQLLHVVAIVRMAVQTLIVDPHITPARLSEVITAAQGKVNGIASALIPYAGRFGAQVADHQARQLDRQTRAMLGVPASVLGVAEHTRAPGIRMDARKAKPQRDLGDRLEEFVHENVALIKSLGNTPLDQIEQLITRGFANGDRHESIARQIVERFGAAEDRARLIARDQIGKLNGRISADRHQKMGLTNFRWRNVHDKRVRPLHVLLENQSNLGAGFSYAKPPSEGLPGTPIACRCHDEPVFDDVLAELDRLEAQRAPVKPPRVARPLKVAPPKPVAPPAPKLPTLPSEGKSIVAALATGDHRAALTHLDTYLERRGLTPSSTRNGPITVSDTGMSMTTHSGDKVVADAFREWDGHIQLSVGVAKNIDEWAKLNKGRSPQEIEASHDKLMAGSDRLGSEWRTAGAAKRAKLDPDHGEREHAQAMQERKAVAAEQAPRVLVHETLHGFSPLQPGAYFGRAGQIEEITTETMARVIARDLFGTTIIPSTGGSYQFDITAATNAIGSMSGVAEPEAFKLLQRASERFKQRKNKFTAEHQVTSAFADDVAAVIGHKSPSKVQEVLEFHLADAAKKTAERYKP